MKSHFEQNDFLAMALNEMTKNSKDRQAGHGEA
jgi:hypothetical protein